MFEPNRMGTEPLAGAYETLFPTKKESQSSLENSISEIKFINVNNKVSSNE